MAHILISKDNIKNTGESMKLKCIFCNKETSHRVGYMGSLCLDCNLEMFDIDSWKDVYNHIKNKYSLERKDVAGILKLSVNTISTYQSNNIGFLVKKLLELHYTNKLSLDEEMTK